MEIIALGAAYIISFILSRMGMYAASGILLMAAAVILAGYYCIKYGRRINPPAVFSMSWTGGIGIACLKLSYLETDWETLTWAALFAAYAAFAAGYKLVRCKAFRDKYSKCTDGSQKQESGLTQNAAAESDLKSDSDDSISAERVLNRRSLPSGEGKALYIMMNAVALISVVSLLIEASLLGYIPLFTVDTPHAYSYFHISGLHYFTVSCCLLPALGTLCIWQELMSGRQYTEDLGRYATNTVDNKKRGNNASIGLAKRADIIICMSIGVLIPIMLVSRYQLFFGILLAGFCILVLNGMRFRIKLNIKHVLAAAACCFILIMLYVFITIERAHSVEYLNGIFEMKYKSLPIFISQPYIYIANNFDNFNCLVKELPSHTHGLRMLFPVIALTGLKFLKPELAAFPIYVTKEELTTVTLIYDSYYDFGLAGVILFAMAVGAAAALIERRVLRGLSANATDQTRACSATAEGSDFDKDTENVTGLQESDGAEQAASGSNPFTILLYAQVMIYLSLAFFTTWLSNPTTWFLFGVTVIGMILVRVLKHREF